jgi:hypothetical protein
MGGSDDPSNLVLVSIEEHAELHLALYLEHGRWQDWYAYHGLSGKTDEVERMRVDMLVQNNKTNNPMWNSEYKEKSIRKMKQWWNDNPDMRKVVAERQRNLMLGVEKSEQHKHRISLASTNRWSDQKNREEQSDKIRQSWVERRKNGGRKLTDDQIAQIRQSSKTNKSLSEQYGVSVGHISNIKKYRVYKDLP